MRRAGFTLVELLLALGLLSLLVVALVRLLDTSLRIWGRTETDRDLVEVGSAVLELLGRDLLAIEAGPRGDLVVDWFAWDVDGDGIAGLPMPRAVLVKRPSRAELAALGGGGELVEVAWVLVPDPDAPAGARALGELRRGERLVGDGATLSFLDERFLLAGRPSAGATTTVTGGVLWLGLQLATQTSVVSDGWSVGGGLADAATSWDAWGRGRPDPDRSAWNEPAAGMPRAGELPLLPRRVRIELELERPEDVVRRPRLAEPLEADASALVVDDGTRLPEPGAFVLVGEEWMEVRGVSGDRASVARGARGSRRASHPAGERVHHGRRLVREVPLALHREDWDL